MRTVAARTVGAIGDITLMLLGTAVVALQAADLTGVLDLKWFRDRTPAILVLLLGIMILYAVLERRLLLERHHRETAERLNILVDNQLSSRLQDSGVRNIYTSRADYQKFRGHTDLLDYVASAHSSVHILAHWLAHGIGMEGIGYKLANLVQERGGFTATVAVANPDGPLPALLASYFGSSEDEVRARCAHSLAELTSARASLPSKTRARFEIRSYNSLPVASIILLDGGSDHGRIQLDFKAYRTPRQCSFGIEIRPTTSGLYARFKDAMLNQIADATIAHSP